MASRGRHGSMNFVAMRRVRRCGLRVAFVAHTQEFRCSAAFDVSNDAHRLNCHEMSGKRFHGLVTVY